MKLKLIEATPERRREVAQSGVTPKVLLRRWAYMAFAIVKFVVGLLVTGLVYFFAWAPFTETGLITGDLMAILFILGLPLVGRLFFAWAFPVRY